MLNKNVLQNSQLSQTLGITNAINDSLPGAATNGILGAATQQAVGAAGGFFFPTAPASVAAVGTNTVAKG